MHDSRTTPTRTAWWHTMRSRSIARPPGHADGDGGARSGATGIRRGPSVLLRLLDEDAGLLHIRADDDVGELRKRLEDGAPRLGAQPWAGVVRAVHLQQAHTHQHFLHGFH